MSRNDTLRIRIELEDGVDGLRMADVSQFIDELEQAVGWLGIDGAELLLIAEPRIGSIELVFVCECTNTFANAPLREAAQAAGVSLHELINTAVGVATLLLTATFSPWGTLAKSLGRSRPPPADDDFSQKIAKLVDQLPPIAEAEASMIRAKASMLRAKSVSYDFRGYGQVTIFDGAKPRDFSADILHAAAIARSFDLALTAERKGETWSVAFDRGHSTHGYNIADKDVQALGLPKIVRDLIIDDELYIPPEDRLPRS